MDLLIYLIIWLGLVTLFILRNSIPPIITYKIADDVKDIAKKPTKHYHAACFDLYSVEDLVIPTGQWRSVRTGVTFASWPHIYIDFANITFAPLGNIACKIHTRSSLAIRRGIRNHLGIIDNDYRGECNPIMYNHNKEYPVRIHKGDKIAQVEFYRVSSPILWRRKKLSKSARGNKGFGSSGR